MYWFLYGRDQRHERVNFETVTRKNIANMVSKTGGPEQIFLIIENLSFSYIESSS